MVLPSFFPAEWILGSRGSGGDEEPSGGRIFRPSQIQVISAVYTEAVRIMSRQALSNCPVGHRMTRTNASKPCHDTLAWLISFVRFYQVDLMKRERTPCLYQSGTS